MHRQQGKLTHAGMDATLHACCNARQRGYNPSIPRTRPLLCCSMRLYWLCTTVLRPERTCTADEPCCGHEEGENAESLHGAMKGFMSKQFVLELLGWLLVSCADKEGLVVREIGGGLESVVVVWGVGQDSCKRERKVVSTISSLVDVFRFVCEW